MRGVNHPFPRPFPVIPTGNFPLFAHQSRKARVSCPARLGRRHWRGTLAGGYRYVATRAPLADVNLCGDALTQFGDVADDTDDATAGPEAV